MQKLDLNNSTNIYIYIYIYIYIERKKDRQTDSEREIAREKKRKRNRPTDRQPERVTMIDLITTVNVLARRVFLISSSKYFQLFLLTPSHTIFFSSAFVLISLLFISFIIFSLFEFVPLFRSHFILSVRKLILSNYLISNNIKKIFFNKKIL